MASQRSGSGGSGAIAGRATDPTEVNVPITKLLKVYNILLNKCFLLINVKFLRKVSVKFLQAR